MKRLSGTICRGHAWPHHPAEPLLGKGGRLLVDDVSGVLPCFVQLLPCVCGGGEGGDLVYLQHAGSIQMRPPRTGCQRIPQSTPRAND